MSATATAPPPSPGAGTTADPTRTPRRTGRPRSRAVPVGVALVAASLPMFMATLDNLVMTTALPVLQVELAASLEQLQWMVNAYTLSFASLMIAAATLGDRWGRRRVFVAGITVFALASVASAMATDAGTLIAARAVQGAGAAAVMPLSLTLLAGAVPAARRAMAIGVWGAVSGLGVALGPVIGGAVVDGIAWQAIFWINVPVAVVAIPLVRRALPESHGHRQPLDLVGLALAGTGVLSTVWAIVRGNDDGWASTRVVGGLLLGTLLLAAFLVRENRTAHPLVPLRLFRVRSFGVANATALLFSVGVFGIVFLLSQYLQVGLGYSPLEAGVRTLPWTAAPMLVAPIAGALAPRVGVRPLLTAGLALQALGLAWQGALVGGDVVYADLVPGLALAGIGMGLTFAPSATAVLADMGADDHGTASSVNATVRELGGALGVAVLVAVFTAADGTLSPTGYTAGLQPAMLAAAAIVGAGALLALLMPRATGRGQAVALH
ncbi:DHA2 family efflux MFS transporter permease subunit [Cellulomonas fimi]|uniref:Drug resistance transporter, EmrB/QacA subfamily n=1 Tax=Cellulomonas fimi (strain ATCC 484 / DSM 20113 / JCM 1341 / CCUG 24087 / LMG 16345 / NBRC 15513 / NCIMB 8980 / NCTC 7547 / NRS-133) TaxID=590998 RepID=F4H734_CELFA|nr:DHA2 family efflux MFS transporter permease subunit [Cellulomonas fimi]AEE45668.1 drug resistance transporter, EmrB/QacA subfamily [Cellulomonas fimi ATCC 484]VEH30235.1 Spectinomycin tetracycline efflux pump [Cellulomonas fimi]